MEFLAALVAIVALFLALKLRKRVANLELRLVELSGIQPIGPQPTAETPAAEPPFAAPETAVPPAERMDEPALDAVINEAAPPCGVAAPRCLRFRRLPFACRPRRASSELQSPCLLAGPELFLAHGVDNWLHCWRDYARTRRVAPPFSAETGKGLPAVDPPGGFYGIMPALTPDGLGQKIVTFYPPNAAKGIPTHMALIVLNDPQTGAPLAVVLLALFAVAPAPVFAAAVLPVLVVDAAVPAAPE